MSGGMPARVRVVEVGPRDGLQNEPEVIPLEAKLAFIGGLAEAGLPMIEVGAFVRPDLVPQMADSDQVVSSLDLGGGPAYVCLVANEQGLDRALEAGVRHIALFTAASPAFARRNIGMSVEASLALFRTLVARASAAGVWVRGYVSTAWWCPFAGRVDPGATLAVTEALLDMGCDEVSVADTIGAATPAEVEEVLAQVLGRLPVERIAVHFHETRGTGLANTLVALRLGVAIIDAAAGGIGGCPFAPGAPGNLSTEDLLYMLHGLKIETGVDIERVRRASLELQRALGRPLPSRYLHAGPLTPRGDGDGSTAGG